MAEEDAVESRLTLPDRLDYAAGVTLMADLQERMCAPVVVDAGKVKHLGAFSAQVILAAQKQWEIDERSTASVGSHAIQKANQHTHTHHHQHPRNTQN